jgi:hypothetical protein
MSVSVGQRCFTEEPNGFILGAGEARGGYRGNEPLYSQKKGENKD